MSVNLGGDFVIVRADGTPLYHFTVVVDDAAMGITDVIRGEDHLSNTPKHILLFRALGHERAAVRPPAAHPQPGPHEDEQAQEPDRDRRLHRPGLHPRGAGQLPRPARLVDRDRGGDPVARRPRRALRHPRRPQGRRRVRPRATRVAQRPVDPAPRAGRPDRSLASVPRGRARGRPDRVDAERRGAPRPAPGHPGAPADARRRRRPRRVPVGRPSSTLDPAMLVPKRWDAATDAGGAGRRPRDDRGRR